MNTWETMKIPIAICITNRGPFLIVRATKSAAAPPNKIPTKNAPAMPVSTPATPLRSKLATSESQGAAQSVWMAICAPAVVITYGAIRQNSQEL